MRCKRSFLDKEKIAKLESIGFVWRVVRRENTWEGLFEDLKNYKERFGDCRVPKSWEENPVLAGWVHRTRNQRNKLEAERIEQLDGIGFDWGPCLETDGVEAESAPKTPNDERMELAVDPSSRPASVTMYSSDSCGQSGRGSLQKQEQCSTALDQTNASRAMVAGDSSFEFINEEFGNISAAVPEILVSHSMPTKTTSHPTDGNGDVS